MSNEQKKTPSPGDTVYTADGRECVLVSREPDGYIVRAVLEFGDDHNEPRGQDLEDPELVRQAYVAPPSARYEEAAAKARIEADKAQADAAAARAELRTLEMELANRRAKLSAHPDLAPLVEFLDGAISHIAVCDYGSIKIMPIRDALKSYSDYGNRVEPDIRMLAIYGGYTGPDGCSDAYRERQRYFNWKLSHYADGSGSGNKQCFIGPSEEVVRQRLQTWLGTVFKQYGPTDNYGLSMARSACDLGLSVPLGHQQAVNLAAENARNAEAERIRKAAAQAEQNLAAARAALATIEPDTTGATP